MARAGSTNPDAAGVVGYGAQMAGVSPLVLVVEDEAAMRKFLRVSLEKHDFRYIEAATAREGLTQARAYNPDVVLLDLGLPDLDGLHVTKELRGWTSAPIIVVSARGQEQDKIDALDAGADDYLTKPFGTGELMARIRVALRHGARPLNAPAETVVTSGELRIDIEARRIFVGEREAHLTPIEYKLLVTLAKSADKVLTHRYLLKEVWGPSHATQVQYLRVYMAALRQKLERDSARPRCLITEPGVGYRFKIAEP